MFSHRVLCVRTRVYNLVSKRQKRTNPLLTLLWIFYSCGFPFRTRRNICPTSTQANQERWSGSWPGARKGRQGFVRHIGAPFGRFVVGETTSSCLHFFGGRAHGARRLALGAWRSCVSAWFQTPALWDTGDKVPRLESPSSAKKTPGLRWCTVNFRGRIFSSFIFLSSSWAERQ